MGAAARKATGITAGQWMNAAARATRPATATTVAARRAGERTIELELVRKHRERQAELGEEQQREASERVPARAREDDQQCAERTDDGSRFSELDALHSSRARSLVGAGPVSGSRRTGRTPRGGAPW